MAAKSTKSKSSQAAGEEFADRMADAAHEAIDDLEARAEEAEEDLVRRARAGGESLARRAGGVLQRVTNYIEDHPFMSVTVAFGIGILATTLLRSSGINLAKFFAPEEPPSEDEYPG